MDSSFDLSPLLKAAARLLDLHDSRRGTGESPQYQSEERAGRGDGHYVAIGTCLLDALQQHGKRSGDEFASLAYLQQQVRSRYDAVDVDIEYVLNVLARPSELRLLAAEDDQPAHVVGDKESNLVEKAAHLVEFRLSRVGKTALAMAADHLDIKYIEGDVTKLIRALEAGRLGQALKFIDRLLEQLRMEHLALRSLIERFGARARRVDAKFDDIAQHVQIMQQAVELVRTAQLRVEDIIQNDRPVRDEDIPVGLVRERINELSRAIVRYSRELSDYAGRAASATSTAVAPPGFADLARRWILTPPPDRALTKVFAAVGPADVLAPLPSGLDFRGCVRQRRPEDKLESSLALDGYAALDEHRFVAWLEANRAALERHLVNGGLTMEAAIEHGFARHGEHDAFECLVSALSGVDIWGDGRRLTLTLGADLSTAALQTTQVMFSPLLLRAEDAGASPQAQERTEE